MLKGKSFKNFGAKKNLVRLKFMPGFANLANIYRRFCATEITRRFFNYTLSIKQYIERGLKTLPLIFMVMAFKVGLGIQPGME